MAMAEQTHRFCEAHPCKGLLYEKAARLRERAEAFEALADALPDVFPTVEAENAMRSLINQISKHE